MALPVKKILELTSAGSWCPLLVGELLVQLSFIHLPDEDLEQAANHEQCIVGLPDKKLAVEEKNKTKTSQGHASGWLKDGFAFHLTKNY